MIYQYIYFLEPISSDDHDNACATSSGTQCNVRQSEYVDMEMLPKSVITSTKSTDSPIYIACQTSISTHTNLTQSLGEVTFEPAVKVESSNENEKSSCLIEIIDNPTTYDASYGEEAMDIAPKTKSIYLNHYFSR